jgi:plastocyanin
MRSPTITRSVNAFTAFVIGLVATTVVLIAVLVFVPLGSDAVPYPTPAPSSGGGGAGGGTAGGPPPAGDNAFNAEEKEYAIALDKTQIKAGSITFNVKNVGTLPHNLAIKELNKATENIDAGKSATLTVDLQPGTYTVICEIPGHEQLGMHVTITVT